MVAQILVENKIGTKGFISSITDMGHKWSHNETLSAWVAKFPERNLSEYHRNFSLIIATDKLVSELEYLTEPLIINEDPVSAKWQFIEPEITSPEWSELFQTGQIEKTWLELLPYLRELT